jgi:esterase/lipase superfamily enzyme
MRRLICFVVALSTVLSLAAPAPAQDAATKPSATGKPPAATKPAPSGTKPAATLVDDDWAAALVKADPLAAKTAVTLADLRAALADPRRADSVIKLHFARAELTEDERVAFLREALAGTSLEARRQAAHELENRNLLGTVVARELLAKLKGKDAADYAPFVGALARCPVAWSDAPKEYVRAVLEALSSSDAQTAEAARSQLKVWGADAVPDLLEALQSDDAKLHQAAATGLGIIVGRRAGLPDIAFLPKTPGAGATKPLKSSSPAERPTVAKGAPVGAMAQKHAERVVEEEKPEMVRVYYGTNRELVERRPDPRFRLYGLPVVFLVVAYLTFRTIRRSITEKTFRTGFRAVFVTASSLGVTVFLAMLWMQAMRESLTETSGVVYGPKREQGGGMHYGYCDVSIPPTHKVGHVETPIFTTEDENEHVVLKHNEELEQAAFYKQVKGLLAHLPPDERSCFVFVHGYNVSFEKAAKRTAQIHFDLQFAGVPMFYSWPSRAAVRSYFSDRNEIGYSAEHVKNFLLDAARKLDAKRIHVIAHSMGADAVSRAIVAMGDQGQIFDQIVLAAPDVDADVFREQIAPRMQKVAKRTTVYCSRNDWALHASYAFNDSVRLGDSSRGIVVIDGMDTIDASDIDTDLLGHSYYGDCLTLLSDVQLLIQKNLPPIDRRLSQRTLEKAMYWTFGKEAAADAGSPRMTAEPPALK